jgi:exopolyphosphatase / guanosine-5'-triphosphate,3'-diphosphate pyrophosphatase
VRDASTGERLGCLDIGSNTTRLLVADRDGRHLTWIHQERVFTRIGEELLVGDRLGQGKIEEVVGVVAAQLATARELGAVTVRGVATAAIRNAANGDDLIRAIQAATGVAVEVLSDREEARLAFIGVAGTLEDPPAGSLGVVDVGGGSSELVVGTAPDQVGWWASLAVGSAILSGTGSDPEPPSPSRLSEARARIAAELGQLRVPRPDVAVAAGGSATSLGRLVGPVLDASSLRRALVLITGAPAAEVGQRFGIDPQRVRLLPAGLLILEAVAGLFGGTLHVGRGGIREGVLLEA